LVIFFRTLTDFSHTNLVTLFPSMILFWRHGRKLIESGNVGSRRDSDLMGKNLGWGFHLQGSTLLHGKKLGA
jgi:hypothetical protein